MDINEKIAARRRELEAQEAAQRAALRQREAERREQRRQAHASVKDDPELAAKVDAEVARRLKSMGVDPIQGARSNAFDNAVAHKIHQELDKAAHTRAQQTHGWPCAALVVLGIAMGSIASWIVGFVIIGWAFWLYNKAHKTHLQALMEHKDSVSAVEPSNPSGAEEPRAKAAFEETDKGACKVCKKEVSPLDSRCPSCFSLLK